VFVRALDVSFDSIGNEMLQYKKTSPRQQRHIMFRAGRSQEKINKNLPKKKCKYKNKHCRHVYM